jgi:hypothetical protein
MLLACGKGEAAARADEIQAFAEANGWTATTLGDVLTRPNQAA